MSPAKKRTTTISDDHKAALAVGRTEGRAVRNYLEALEAHKPRRGRKRTPDSIEKRLEAINAALEETDPLGRLQLIQERMDLETELASMQAGIDLEALETDFVEAAHGYSARKGISYAAWRELGVPPNVLKRAGITRSGN
jgi:hypothetical protein